MTVSKSTMISQVCKCHLANGRKSHLAEVCKCHLAKERKSHLADVCKCHLAKGRKSHLAEVCKCHLAKERKCHLAEVCKCHLAKERKSHLAEVCICHLAKGRKSHLAVKRKRLLAKERKIDLTKERKSHLVEERFERFALQDLWHSVLMSRSFQFEYYGRQLTPSIAMTVEVKQANSIVKSLQMNITRKTSGASEMVDDVTVDYDTYDVPTENAETYCHNKEWTSSFEDDPDDDHQTLLTEMAKPALLLQPDIHDRMCALLAMRRHSLSNKAKIFLPQPQHVRNSRSGSYSRTSRPRNLALMRHSALKCTELVGGNSNNTSERYLDQWQSCNQETFSDFRGLATRLGLSALTIYWLTKQRNPEALLVAFYSIICKIDKKPLSRSLNELHHHFDMIGHQAAQMLLTGSIEKALESEVEEERKEHKNMFEEFLEDEKTIERRSSLTTMSDYLVDRVRRESIHLEEDEVKEELNRAAIRLTDGCQRAGYVPTKLTRMEAKARDLQDKLDGEIGRFTEATLSTVETRLSLLRRHVQQVFITDTILAEKFLNEITDIELQSSIEGAVQDVVELVGEIDALEAEIQAESHSLWRTLSVSIRAAITELRHVMKRETKYCPEVSEPCKDSLKIIEYEIPAARTSTPDLVQLQRAFNDVESRYRDRSVHKAKSIYQSIMNKLRWISERVDEDLSNDPSANDLRSTVQRQQREANESFGFLVQLQELLWQVENTEDIVKAKLEMTSQSLKQSLQSHVNILQQTMGDTLGISETTSEVKLSLERVGRECTRKSTSLTRLRKLTSDVVSMETKIHDAKKNESRLRSKLENKILAIGQKLPSVSSYQDIEMFKKELNDIAEETRINKLCSTKLKDMYHTALDIEKRMEEQAALNKIRNAVDSKMKKIDKSVRSIYPPNVGKDLQVQLEKYKKELSDPKKTVIQVKRLERDTTKLEVKVKDFLEKIKPLYVDYDILCQIAEIVQPVWIPTNAGLEMPKLKHISLVRDSGLRGDAKTMLHALYEKHDSKFKWNTLLMIVRRLDNTGDVYRKLKEIRALSGLQKI
uniref:Intracellular protein transport protein USO1-like n=1 Tax=Saccoglossus kowalevskii TaxID=10224 RepID=A0ABM0MP31_SACKO|nr:PREDICTED: intracellular protein transport protein USO1-like [Saccoglossus kowalevskii]